MALEQTGGVSLEKLINRIKEKYPNHNFDVLPEPDTKCKSQFQCNGLRNITYYDKDNNIFCGRRYKLQDDNNPNSWAYRECHALLQKGQQGQEPTELPF